MLIHRNGVLLFLMLLSAIPATGARRPAVNGKIAFVSDRDGNREVYVMNPDGSEQTRLTNHPLDDFDPAWSPDGVRIAFVRDRILHVMNADGSGVTSLGQDAHNPAWSPDGRLIAFSSSRGAGATIFTVAPDGSNLSILTKGDDPSWSADGRRLAFTRVEPFNGQHRDNICIANADGTDVQFVTNGLPNGGGPFDATPSFSPDGSSIVFARDRVNTLRAHVHVINVDGSNEQTLAAGATGAPFFDDTRPVYSPDGRRIAFAFEERGEDGASIRLMSPDGSHEVQITNNAGVRDTQPAWQRLAPPDTIGVYVPSTGQWLLRNSNTAGDPDLITKLGGEPGDLPVAGDWNGDGQTDLAIFRNGVFLRAALNQPCFPCGPFTFVSSMGSIAFGEPGDLPVAGDWNGDGVDDIGVFRSGEIGTFLLRVPQEIRLCPACPPHTIITTQTVSLGTTGHLPIAGDWDGDGKDGAGLYDPVTTNFILSDDLAKPSFFFPFGLPGDRPLSGDWIGSGRDGIGVFQPPATTMALSPQVPPASEIVFAFGVDEGIPVAGRWTPVP